MEKPFYTQFEKLRNELKDKDKIIQEQNEELLILENSISEVNEKLYKALKIIEDNNLAFFDYNF